VYASGQKPWYIKVRKGLKHGDLHLSKIVAATGAARNSRIFEIHGMPNVLN